MIFDILLSYSSSPADLSGKLCIISSFLAFSYAFKIVVNNLEHNPIDSKFYFDIPINLNGDVKKLFRIYYNVFYVKSKITFRRANYCFAEQILLSILKQFYKYLINANLC